MNPRVRALMAVARAQTTKADPEPFGFPAADIANLTGPEQAVVDDLTAWFASTRSVPGQELPNRFITELTDLGLPRRAAIEAGRLAMPPPLTGRTRYGSPGPLDDMSVARRVAWQEPGMRARFVLASSQRLARAIDEDREDAQLTDERRYRDDHVAMGRRRRQAARAMDEAAKESPNGWLVWRCGDNPEATCSALDGRAFPASLPPAIAGAVHLHCRCHVEPWNGPTPMGSR